MTQAFCGSRSPTCSSVLRLLARRLALLVLPAILLSSGRLCGQQESEEVPDMSGNYSFLAAGDTLALLEEEGKLKGYIDVLQGEDESDAILSYSISLGWRKKNQVEFKTRQIHRKYYRFSGAIQRGSGRRERDPDYLRLVGDLEIITVNPETGEEVSERKHVVFKSMGPEEEED
jgi:hypothetical protein